MSIAIINASILLGKSLDYVDSGYIEIENGIIKRAGIGEYKGSSKRQNAENFLIIPGLINAHTHIADSIGKDISTGHKLDARVHPMHGAKKKILEKSKPEHLKAFIRSSAISMTKKGIVAFADFREGGPEGVRLLKEAIADLSIKCIVLGRADYYCNNPKEGKSGLPLEITDKVRQVLQLAEGLGISGANENTDLMLAQYRQMMIGKKLLAIHAAESKETVEFSKAYTRRSEIERIMAYLKPDFVVHMTKATEDEIQQLARSNIGIVICPRANGVLATGIPQVTKMLRNGSIVAVGTDNVMLNSPDVLRELDYIWKTSQAIGGEMVEAREILKMATVNAAQILRLNSGCIESGRAADLVFIDKKNADIYPMHDPYAAIIQRLSQSSISAIMIDGRFIQDIN